MANFQSAWRKIVAFVIVTLLSLTASYVFGNLLWITLLLWIALFAVLRILISHFAHYPGFSQVLVKAIRKFGAFLALPTVAAAVIAAMLFPLLNPSIEKTLYSTGKFGEPSGNRFVRTYSSFSPYAEQRYELLVEIGIQSVQLKGLHLQIDLTQQHTDPHIEHWFGAQMVTIEPSSNETIALPWSVQTDPTSSGRFNQTFRVNSAELELKRDSSYYIRFSSGQPLFVKRCLFVSNEKEQLFAGSALSDSIKSEFHVESYFFPIPSFVQHEIDADSLRLELTRLGDSIQMHLAVEKRARQLQESSWPDRMGDWNGYTQRMLRWSDSVNQVRQQAFSHRLRTIDWKLSRIGVECQWLKTADAKHLLTLEDVAVDLKLIADTL